MFIIYINNSMTKPMALNLKAIPRHIKAFGAKAKALHH